MRGVATQSTCSSARSTASLSPETEFETDEEMRAFALPSFAFLDVTNDEMFTGGRLVDLTIDEIRAELKRARGKAEKNNELSRGRLFVIMLGIAVIASDC
jgi:hypothetical protein